MDFAVPLWPLPFLTVVGSERRFPVRRIYCVGRNYAAHAREMGADPTREPPFFFQKPSDAVIASGAVASAASFMQKLKIPQARIDAIVQKKDTEALAKVVKELMGKE